MNTDDYEARALGIFVGRNPSTTIQISSAAGFKGHRAGYAEKGKRLIRRLVGKGLIVSAPAADNVFGPSYAITPAGRKVWLEYRPGAAESTVDPDRPYSA